MATKLERHIDEIDSIFPRRQYLSDDRKARLWRCRSLLESHIRQPLLRLYRPFVLGLPNVPSQILGAYLRHSASIVESIEDLDPAAHDHEASADLCHVGIKGDALQAALSMCYYICAATQPCVDRSLVGVEQALRMLPETDTVTTCSNDGIVWSMSRLIHAVDKVREFLIQNIKRGNTKDIICLSVVLESVRTPEPRAEDMARELRVVLDQYLRTADCSIERLTASSSSTTQPDGWVFWDGWE